MLDDEEDWAPFNGAQDWIDNELPKMMDEQVVPMIDAEFGPNHPDRAKILARCREHLERAARRAVAAVERNHPSLNRVSGVMH